MFTFRNILLRDEGLLRALTPFTVTKASSSSSTLEMDKIRARSVLKHVYVYDPPHDIIEIIKTTAKQYGLGMGAAADWETTNLSSLDSKEKLLLELGSSLKHFVPNSQLHKMKTLNDLVKFYSEPFKNVSKYVEMARSDELPKNLSIMEQPRRFHPNDNAAPHGGITAFPGEGGKVFGIRSQRLSRQFKPKKDWFDYEDQTFNHDVTLATGMPWDPEIARKMDSHQDIRFTKNHLKKIK